jgi:hypothetical protein
MVYYDLCICTSVGAWLTISAKLGWDGSVGMTPLPMFYIFPLGKAIMLRHTLTAIVEALKENRKLQSPVKHNHVHLTLFVTGIHMDNHKSRKK